MHIEKSPKPGGFRDFGAAIQIRTGDLILTNYEKAAAGCCLLMLPVACKALRRKGLRVFLRVACRVLTMLEIGWFLVAVWVLYGFFTGCSVLTSSLFAERKPGGVLSLSGFLDCISDDLSSAADAFGAGMGVHAQRG